MDDTRELTIAQPRDLQVAPTSMSGLLGVEERRQIAEVMARMLKAQLAPRALRMTQLKNNVLTECTARHLAEVAVYQYSRGGTDVNGPSIRLVEMISNHWGNIDSGIQILHRGRDEKGVEFSEARAEAVDMETGRRDYRDFVVKHWRDTKKGGYPLTDERDIAELIYSQGQRRKRACILSLLPMDLVDEAVAQCDRTLAADPSLSSKEALQKMVAMFAPMGVTQKMIETFCQCHLEAIKPAQVVRLRKIYVSINDGMSTADSWFGTEQSAWEQVETRHEETRKQAPRKQAAKQDRQATDGGEAGEGEGVRPPSSSQQTRRQTPVPPQGEAAGEVGRASPAPKPPPAPQAPPTTALAPAFEYVLMDAGGEPIGEDMITEPRLFLEMLAMELQRPGANRVGLLEHNADAIEDAREVVPDDVDELLTTMGPGAEETPKEKPAIEPIPLQLGKDTNQPLWPLYLRQFTHRMSTASEDDYYDICAVEHERIQVAPSSIKLNLIKRANEKAQALGIAPAQFGSQEPPSTRGSSVEGDQAEQQPAPPPKPDDKDAAYCEAHCAEMLRLTTLDELRRFTQHPAISRRYQQWKKERPDLAQKMDDAQAAAEVSFR